MVLIDDLAPAMTSNGRRFWIFAGVIAVLFAAALLASNLLGADARRACLLAIAVSAAAGIGGVAPVLAASKFWPDYVAIAAMAASMIRLLLVAAGVGIVMLFVPVEPRWFVLWLAVFYFAMLSLEAAWALKLKVKS
jgi:hypothetical protein